jgi:hypothetical protein
MGYYDDKDKVRTFADVRSDLSYARTNLDSAERAVQFAREKVARLEAEAAVLAWQSIDFIAEAPEQDRIKTAVAQVRKSFKGITGITYRATKDTYDGSRNLSEPIYISYPVGKGVGDALAAALVDAGLLVDWDGSEYRAITVLPTRRYSSAGSRYGRYGRDSDQYAYQYEPERLQRWMANA